MSSRAAIASGRCRPSAFGMYVRRDGWGRYAPRWTRPCRSASLGSSSASYSPHVMPSTPAAASRRNAKNAARKLSGLTWWSSAVNRSSFRCLAACRTRSSAWVTRSRFCVRGVRRRPTFSSAPAPCSSQGQALGSAGSASGCPALFVGFTAVGSEEAPTEGLASVRRSNGTCSFPAFRFHEWLREIRREGISETRLTSLNSPKSRLVGYSFQPVFRHRLARCDHSLRTIHPSSWWKRFLTWERQ